MGKPTYRNKLKSMPKVIARIVDDVQGEPQISGGLQVNSTQPYLPPQGGITPLDQCTCCAQSVNISKDDQGDFTTVQEGIDYAVTFTPTANDPWVVTVCPGEFTENITMADYVSLVGIGTKEHAAIIIGQITDAGTGPKSIENICIKHPVGPNYLMRIVGGTSSTIRFRNCAFIGVWDSAVPNNPFSLSSANDIRFEGCYFNLQITGDDVAATTQRFFVIGGATGSQYFTDCVFDLGTEDNDDINIIWNLNDSVDFQISNCKFKIYDSGMADISSIWTFLKGELTAADESLINNNEVEFIRASAGGNLSIYSMTALVPDQQTIFSNYNRFSGDSQYGFKIYQAIAVNRLFTQYDDLDEIPISPIITGTFEYNFTNDFLTSALNKGSERMIGPSTIMNPPIGRAMMTTAPQAFLAGATAVILDTVDYDSNLAIGLAAFYNPLTGVWTIPFDGRYEICAKLKLDFTPALPIDFNLQILINGVARSEEHADFPFTSPGTVRSISVNDKFNGVVAGSLITLVLNSTGAGSILNDAVGLYSSMTVERIN